MPAKSELQRKLFGLALSVKRGETSRAKVSKKVLDIVDGMTEEEIRDFAIKESETMDYAPPEFVVKPAENDTGYALVKKNYKRRIWTWNEHVKESSSSDADFYKTSLDEVQLNVRLEKDQYTEEIRADVFWDATIDHRKNGIMSIDPIIKSVVVSYKVITPGDQDDKVEELVFNMGGEVCDVVNNGALPFYPKSVETNGKTCVVVF